MTTRIPTLVTMAILVAAAACTSPQKLVEYGNYDEALSLSVRKLAGKKKKKEEYVRALEEAFARANERDLREAERLKREGQPGNWDRIHDMYQRIRRRQAAVEPLLPLADQYGVPARVELIDVDGFLNESKQRAAEYLYALARQKLDAAQAGDRQAAREAHDALQRTTEYYPGAYRDRDALLAQARELGITHVLVRVHNESAALLPPGFEQELLRISPRELDSRWRQVHLQPTAGVHYDYRIDLRLANVAVSPTLIREREFQETCEIEDGFEYVLDERGNVKKDSLGNDIKVPRKVRVNAWVLETYQHKAARVSAFVEVFDQRSGRLLDSRPLSAESVFEHRAGRFRGDERALSPDSRRLVRQPFLPAPPDVELLFNAAGQLRPAIRSQLDRSRLM